MNNYKLLTPGPLTTSDSVKQLMLSDRCTWDDDYKSITQEIRRELLELANVNATDYTSVLMQGSGTFGVEATMITAMGDQDKCLIITNGAYGDRLVEIAKYAKLVHVVYNVAWNQQPSPEKLAEMLRADASITHVIFVHCETTTGMLNDLRELAQVVKAHNKILILDAMSSFAGVPIDVAGLQIDYLISSANKCIQGVPGFSFVIAKRDELEQCTGNAHSLSLDLYAQWKTMDLDGKWRYTSPTHVVAAFAQAIKELKAEGGIAARYQRYSDNNQKLRRGMERIGFTSYVQDDWQSPIITAFRYPSSDFDFTAFYNYVKQRGYVLYPGKLTDEDTFRIGTIGEIYNDDIDKLLEIIAEYQG